MKGQCKLCLKENVKLVDSHIVPKSFYLKECKEIKYKQLSEKSFSKKSSQGVYDQFLCSECEALFGQWDDYAYTLFANTKPTNIVENPKTSDALVYEYSDVDYQKIKLFFLSLLWRAHASSKGFFERFNLPYNHADELAEIIKSKVAPEPESWSVFVGKSEQIISFILYEPAYLEIDKALFVKIYFPGYVVFIKINSAPIPASLFLHLLYPGFSLNVFRYDFERNGEITDAVNMISNNLERGIKF